MKIWNRARLRAAVTHAFRSSSRPQHKAVTHRTETLDYVMVLEGEIEMDMTIRP